MSRMLGHPESFVPAVEVRVGQDDVVDVPTTPATKLRLTGRTRKIST